jgi:hypothetical protein
MKYKALLFTFLLGVVQIVSAQTYSTVIPDNEIIDFVEWMAKNDGKSEKKFEKKERKLSARIIPWKYHNIVSRYKTDEFDYLEIDRDYLFKGSNGGLDTLFTQADRDFFLEQSDKINSDVWNRKVNGKKLEQPDREGNSDMRFYSIPLFSRNKEYIFIYRGYDCGYECITGRYNLYKLDKGKWRLIISINNDERFDEEY